MDGRVMVPADSTQSGIAARRQLPRGDDPVDTSIESWLNLDTCSRLPIQNTYTMSASRSPEQ